jgi:hypothetical protein
VGAVDDEHVAGDVRGRGRAQEHRRGGDLVDLAEPPRGDRRARLLAELAGAFGSNCSDSAALAFTDAAGYVMEAALNTKEEFNDAGSNRSRVSLISSWLSSERR